VLLLPLPEFGEGVKGEKEFSDTRYAAACAAGVVRLRYMRMLAMMNSSVIIACAVRHQGHSARSTKAAIYVR
jgi:hypothetical protein